MLKQISQVRFMSRKRNEGLNTYLVMQYRHVEMRIALYKLAFTFTSPPSASVEKVSLLFLLPFDTRIGVFTQRTIPHFTGMFLFVPSPEELLRLPIGPLVGIRRPVH